MNILKRFEQLRRAEKPVTAQTVRRVLLANMLAFGLVMTHSILTNQVALWALAVIPFGLSLGLYISIGEHGIFAAPTEEKE